MATQHVTHLLMLNPENRVLRYSEQGLQQKGRGREGPGREGGRGHKEGRRREGPGREGRRKKREILYSRERNCYLTRLVYL